MGNNTSTTHKNECQISAQLRNITPSQKILNFANFALILPIKVTKQHIFGNKIS